MFTLKLIAGPLIGALIGYCTNFIAVKMLFKPHRPVMLGSLRLPFTPGLIPKRKDELAGAIGNAISDVLLTKEDLAKSLPSEDIKKSITGELWHRFVKAKESSRSVEETISGLISQEQYEKMRDRLEDVITEKAADALKKLKISEIVVEEGTRAIKEKVQGTMLSMMLNDQVIQSVAEPIGAEIERYIEENGENKIRPVVAGELVRLETGGTGALLAKLPLSEARLGTIVNTLYDECIENSVEAMIAKIDIAGIVEEKIREMDVAKLEELILSVMKKELNAIVNLGALIGLFIGLLNLFISML
ncbi:MAG: DUF445 family protein [Firmicutes bacterium]|nr:DUF445 family protein [Bacillota bacterium]